MLTQAAPEKKELPIAEKIITIEEPVELTAKEYKERKRDGDYRKKIVKGDLKIGLAAIQNKRPYMEDFLSYGIDEVKGFERLTQEQQEMALLLTFDDLQTTLGNVAAEGSTGCLAVSYYVKATDTQYTAVVNLGDSLAHSARMTPEAKPAKLLNRRHDAESETSRILAEGGYVTGGRLSGSLELGREFGNNQFVPLGLSHMPEVTFSEEKRNGNQIPILVSSDGLDKLDANKISDIIQENASEPPAVIANKLIDEALSVGQSDNQSQAVMLLDDDTTASIAVFDGTAGLSVSKPISEQVYQTLQKNIQLQLNPEPGQEQALKNRVLMMKMAFHVKQGKLDFLREALAIDSHAVEDELSKLNQATKITLFFEAIRKKENQDLAIYFLSKGAKKEPWPLHNELFDDFNTPLMWAAHFGNEELVALLLKANVNAQATNAQGLTAWQLAKSYPNIQKMISDAVSLLEPSNFEGFSSEDILFYPGDLSDQLRPDTKPLPKEEKLKIIENDLKFNNPYKIHTDTTGVDQDFCRLYTKGSATIGATRIKAAAAQQEDAVAVAIDETGQISYSQASPELRKALNIVALDKIQRKDVAAATTWVDAQGMFHADIACAGDSSVHCFFLNSDGEIQESSTPIQPHETTQSTTRKEPLEFISLNKKLSEGQQVVLIITSDGIKIPHDGIGRALQLLHKESEATISNLLADINYKRYPQDNAVVMVMRATQAVKSALVCDEHKHEDLTKAASKFSYFDFATLLTPPQTPGGEQAILTKALFLEIDAELHQGSIELFIKTWTATPQKIKRYVEKLDDITKNNLWAMIVKDPKLETMLRHLFPLACSFDRTIEVVTPPIKKEIQPDIKKTPSPKVKKEIQPDIKKIPSPKLQNLTSCNLKVIENKTEKKMQLVIEFKKPIEAYLFLDKVCGTKDGPLPKNIQVCENKVICNLRKTRTGNEYALDFESSQTVNSFLATLELKKPKSQLNPFHDENVSSLQYRHFYDSDGVFITHESLSAYDPPLSDKVVDRELFYQEKSIWLPIEYKKKGNPLFTAKGVTIPHISLDKFTVLPAPLELKIPNEIQKSIVYKMTLPGAKTTLFSEEKRITHYLPYVNLFRAKDNHNLVMEFDSEEKLDVFFKQMISSNPTDSKMTQPLTKNAVNKKQLLIPFSFATGDKDYLVPLGEANKMAAFRTLFDLQQGSIRENCLKEVCTLSSNGTVSALHFPKQSPIFNIPGTVLKLGIPPNSLLLQPKPTKVLTPTFHPQA